MLSEIMLAEHRSKSQVVRDAINMYIAENFHTTEADETRPPAGQ